MNNEQAQENSSICNSCQLPTQEKIWEGLLQIVIDQSGWIELQGPPEAVDDFLQRMAAEGANLQIHIHQWCG